MRDGRGRGLGRQAAVAQSVIGFAITGLGACVVLLADDLAVRPERLGWLPATFGLGLLMAAPAGPYLLRRGPRAALVGGSALIAAGAILLATAAAIPAAVAGALLLGTGGAAFVLVTPAMLTDRRDLTRVIGLSSAAAVLAPPAMGLWDAFGPGSGRLVLLVVVPPLLYLAVDAARHPLVTPVTRAGPTAPPAATAPAGPAAIAPAGPAAPAAGPAALAAVAGSWDRPVIARRWAVVVLAVAVEFCFTIWGVARLTGTGVTAGVAALLSTAFPLGMACGRLTAPLLIGRIPVVPAGTTITAASVAVVVAFASPAMVTIGLLGAGLGLAALYPLTLARLVATPGLRPTHAASLGALASGTAILAAPAALARLADVLDLRVAYLVTLPLLAALLLLHRRD